PTASTCERRKHRVKPPAGSHASSRAWSRTWVCRAPRCSVVATIRLAYHPGSLSYNHAPIKSRTNDLLVHVAGAASATNAIRGEAMKPVKSLLLLSVAGLMTVPLMTVAGARAADLPVKAAPVEYLKVCTLYGA